MFRNGCKQPFLWAFVLDILRSRWLRSKIVFLGCFIGRRAIIIQFFPSGLAKNIILNLICVSMTPEYFYLMGFLGYATKIRKIVLIRDEKK